MSGDGGGGPGHLVGVTGCSQLPGPFQRDPGELLPSCLGALAGNPGMSLSSSHLCCLAVLVLQPFIPHQLVCISNGERLVTSQD